jgi:DNA polymerase V
MKQRLFALVDCNNFFASCERVFNPKLNGKPIVILSNNDGCIIARSNEAKKLGIPMGAPVFEYRNILERHDVNVFSANFHLYGDLSNRVMSILKGIARDVQVYSIDEAFIDLSDTYIRDKDEYAKKIRNTIFRQTGVPVSVGIASTKTLAKIATEYAKHNDNNGVCVLDGDELIKSVLDSMPVIDIWGIGFRLSKKLNESGIYTAYDFHEADDRWVRKHLTVSGQRTLFELRGIHCIEGVENKDIKKNIISSRSFGRPVTTYKELSESVATYVARATEKLRRQNSYCSYIGVSVRTGKHAQSQNAYSNYYGMPLNYPTDYTPLIIKTAMKCLDQIYKEGVSYKKSMVFLGGIVPSTVKQQSLLHQQPNSESKDSTMKVMDQINASWGTDTMVLASSGINKAWRAKSQLRSFRFTTSWEEIPVVRI